MKRTQSSGWSSIRTRSQKIRRDLEKLVSETRLLADIQDHDAIRGARIVADEMVAWRTILQEVAKTLEGASQTVTDKAAGFADSLESNVRHALVEAGLAVVGDGSLLIADGIVFIESNTKRPSLHINGKPLDTFKMPSVVEAVIAEAGRLKDMLTQPDQSWAELRNAYDVECRETGRPFGDQIRTLELLPHMVLRRQNLPFRTNPVRENFAPYPYEVFRADLYTLLLSGNLIRDRIRFRYASGSDTKGAVFMYVPALGRVAHVGRVWFEEAPSL